MTHKRTVATATEEKHQPDFSRLPAPLDMTQLVETHDVEPDPPEPRSVWATPDLADMARTNAIGA